MKHFWNFAAAAAMAILAAGAGAVTVSAKDAAEAAPAETTAVKETTAAQTSAATETTTAAQTSAATETTTAAQTSAATETTTAPVKTGWVEENGKRFYRLADGSFAVGEQMIDGIPYLFAASGAQKMDWQTVDGKRWYYDPVTGEAVFGWMEYFGKSFYIDPVQGKLTGAQEVVENDAPLGSAAPAGDESGQYHFDDEGSLQTGFFVYEDTAYYADPESGRCEEGMHSYEGMVFFTDASGVRLTGWQEQDGRRYYISEETGNAVYGLFEADGVLYFGTEDGLLTGESQIGDEPCVFDEITGELHVGWYLKNGELHYLDRETMTNYRNGFRTIDGDTYYFSADGAVVTGLQVIDGKTYYFNEEAVMQYGDQTVDGEAYFFDEQTGAMVAAEEGKYRYDADGNKIYGWQTTEEGTFYTDEVTGLVLPGWQTIGNKDYKFDEDGKMISDGRLYNQLDQKWREVKFSSSSSSSMASSACGIFSFCNAIFALNRSEPDAVEVAKWAIDVGAYKPGGGGTTSAILYRYIEEKYGEQFHFHVDGRYDGVTIRNPILINHLLNGGVAVVNVPNHFMACTGYDPETGLYHILESACSSSRGLEGDSWVSAEKLSSGGSNVGLFVHLSNREETEEDETLGV